MTGLPPSAASEDRADALLAWYGGRARDLPWRRPGTSPWAVLVSEVMLQQTPVARVEPIWAAWMQRWPTPAELAAATPGDAVRMWGKLGYPRRALRLHETSARLVADHGGTVPADVDALLELPGIGAYTARAVATFAFGQRHPVVDINVRRVVARAVAGQGAPGPAATNRDLVAVGALLPADRADAARMSIALMELGALVCTAARPHCPDCPLAPGCAWRRAGFPVYDGPTIRPQRFVGTDRQVRGRLLDVLRAASGPVTAMAMDLAWPEPLQRARALDGLVVDGLVDPLPDGRFALPGRDAEDRSSTIATGRMDEVNDKDDMTDMDDKETRLDPIDPVDEIETDRSGVGEHGDCDIEPAKAIASVKAGARKAKKKTVAAVESSKEVLVEAFDKAIDSIDNRINRP